MMRPHRPRKLHRVTRPPPALARTTSGLDNLGANCYLNAVAQCFWSLPWRPETPFFQELDKDKGHTKLVYATQWMRPKLGHGAQNVGECVAQALEGAQDADVQLTLRISDRCKSCGHTSSRVDALPALHVSMAPTFAEALQCSLGDETVEARCEDGCGKTTQRHRTLAREELPRRLLLVEIKRGAKDVHKQVKGVPHRLFGDFQLFAATINTGGHYAAVVRQGSRWQLADDRRVVDVQDVAGALSRATLLFYARI